MLKAISVFVATAICCSSVCFSQKTIINGKEGNRQLKWSDFPGKPAENSAFAAETSWNIRFHYDKVTAKGDTAILHGFYTIVELDPISWVKADKKTDELLQHEQGHFSLARICMLEMLHTITTTTYLLKDYKQKIRETAKNIVEKYQGLNIKYDVETDHSKRKEQQQQWNAFIKSKLAELGE